MSVEIHDGISGKNIERFSGRIFRQIFGETSEWVSGRTFGEISEIMSVIPRMIQGELPRGVSGKKSE